MPSPMQPRFYSKTTQLNCNATETCYDRLLHFSKCIDDCSHFTLSSGNIILPTKSAEQFCYQHLLQLPLPGWRESHCGMRRMQGLVSRSMPASNEKSASLWKHCASCDTNLHQVRDVNRVPAPKSWKKSWDWEIYYPNLFPNHQSNGRS